MRRVLPIAIALFAIGPSVYLSAQGQPELGAQTVLERYFDALSQGDVGAMQSLLGGQLLNEQSGLLQNPTYPTFLQEMYGSARFTIERTVTATDTDVVIDVSIAMGRDNSSQRRFFLQKVQAGAGEVGTFLIVAETEPH